MHILFADLHEDGARLSQQLPRCHQPISQVRQVRMNSITPGVTIRFNLLRFPRYMTWITVTYIPRGRRPRSEEHTSELQSRENLVCRLLLEKKKQAKHTCSVRT